MGRYTRGVISTFNVSVQKVLPHNFTAQVGYVGNRQNDMVRNQNLNYSQIGGGNASLPFNQPGLAGGFRTTAAHQRRASARQGAVRLAAGERQSPDEQRLRDDLGVHVRESDRLVGRRHPDPGVLASQQGHAGRQHAAQGGHLGDLRAAVRPGPEVRQQRRRGQPYRCRGWQINSYFTAFSGSPFSISASNASLGREQRRSAPIR